MTNKQDTKTQLFRYI